MYRELVKVVKKLRAVTVNANPNAVTICPKTRDAGDDDKKINADPKASKAPLATVICLSTCGGGIPFRLK